MRLPPGPRLQRIDGTIRQKYLRGRLCILFLTQISSIEGSPPHQSFKLTDASMWSMDQHLRQTILLQTAASLHNRLPHGPPRTQKGCWKGQRNKNEKILPKPVCECVLCEASNQVRANDSCAWRRVHFSVEFGMSQVCFAKLFAERQMHQSMSSTMLLGLWEEP